MANITSELFTILYLTFFISNTKKKKKTSGKQLHFCKALKSSLKYPLRVKARFENCWFPELINEISLFEVGMEKSYFISIFGTESSDLSFDGFYILMYAKSLSLQ